MTCFLGGEHSTTKIFADSPQRLLWSLSHHLEHKCTYSSVFEKSRRGGQGLGARHFTQGGRRTVVIGGTFRRNFSGLRAPSALRPEKGLIVVGVSCKNILNWRVPNNRKGRLRRPRGSHGPVAPLPTSLQMYTFTSTVIEITSK